MDFWFYGNLTGNICYLTRFGKPDIFGNKPVQQRKKDRKLSEPVDYINHLQFQVQLPLWTSPNKPGSTIALSLHMNADFVWSTHTEKLSIENRIGEKNQKESSKRKKK